MFKLSSKLNYFQVSKDCAAPEGRVEPSRHREGELAMTNVILSEVPPSGPEINHSPLALQSSTTIQHCPGGSWSWKCLGPSSCWDLSALGNDQPCNPSPGSGPGPLSAYNYCHCPSALGVGFFSVIFPDLKQCVFFWSRPSQPACTVPENPGEAALQEQTVTALGLSTYGDQAGHKEGQKRQKTMRRKGRKRNFKRG